MKKGLIAFIILAAIALIVLENPDLEDGFSKTFHIPQSVQNALHSFDKTVNSSDDVSLENLPTDKKNELEVFKKTFYKEVDELGKTQASPAQVQERLNSLGKSLDFVQIKYLDELLYNKDANDDVKAIAIELLTNSQTQSSLNTLKNFVLESVMPSTLSHIGMNSVMALKLQALEGVSLYSDPAAGVSALTEIQNKSTEKVIMDRATRALQGLEGSAPSLEEQENKALKEVLTK